MNCAIQKPLRTFDEYVSKRLTTNQFTSMLRTEVIKNSANYHRTFKDF